jgi:hypothetical protein
MFVGKKIYPVTSRIYLKLDFFDVDRAKGYGCLWDSRQNMWYFHDEECECSGIMENVNLYTELKPFKIIGDKRFYM